MNPPQAFLHRASFLRVFPCCRALLFLSIISLLVGTSKQAWGEDVSKIPPKHRPNVVYILCDDLGIGDLKAYNPGSKIPTPRLDLLAAQGMRFTDAHSGSAVCSPTRYGILCGRYAWRTKLQQGVLGGLSPSLIAPGQSTVASFLKGQGYRTACIGKWHLGLDWQKLPGKSVSELSIETEQQNRNVDFARPFAGGPLDAGFDEYFGISGSLDMVPYTFLRNRAVVAAPNVDKAFGMRSISDARQTRKGPAAENFEAVDVLSTLTREAIAFIERQASKAKVTAPDYEPFFLYVPFASPHTPIAPSKEWLGKSGMNPYADFVMEQDAQVGELLEALDRNGLNENTIVFFTSDNGCSPEADLQALRKQGHDPCYPFRGHKADIFEGGHRVPMIVRWPGTVAAGSTSSQTVCLTDLYATMADILVQPLSKKDAPDSLSWLRALQGNAAARIRESTIHHSINGSFAIRRGNFKLIFAPDSGGWSDPVPRSKSNDAPLQPLQLYDLGADLQEQHNLAAQRPEVVAELTHRMEECIAMGRSSLGQPLENDVEVNLWRYSNRPDIGNRRPHALESIPELHLLEPAWRSPTVNRESSVLMKSDSGEITARLAFPVEELKSVQTADGKMSFELGKDFRLAEDKQTLIWIGEPPFAPLTLEQMYPPKDSPNSYRHRVDHPEQFMFYAPGSWFHEHNIEVTYRRAMVREDAAIQPLQTKEAGSDRWAKLGDLPRSIRKLHQGETLRVAISGDSISTGLDASGTTGTYPNQPGYPELIRAQWESSHGSNILMVNRSVPGWSVANGVQDLDRLLQSKPDLLVVAYGMNDVGRKDPDWFEEQTKAIIDKARSQFPEIEIILVATMVGNSEWIHTPRPMFTLYRDRLRKLTGPGIALADLTEVWLTLLQHKHDLDLTGNGLNHPNDFGHRLYAQAILEQLH